jgi:hypothetical protein
MRVTPDRTVIMVTGDRVEGPPARSQKLHPEGSTPVNWGTPAGGVSRKVKATGRR